MIKTIIAVSLIFAVQSVAAQQIPTANTGGGINNSNYWSRQGNNNSGGGINNIFGTKYNSPIYTITDQAYRTKLNANFTQFSQYPINGYLGADGVNTSGYMLLGVNNALSNGQSIYFNKGAFSLLHLNGPTSSAFGGVQETGYRPWMKTGITLTGNSDLMYTGIRQLQTGFDRTEFVTAWSDNAANGFPGPDDYAFRFIASGGTTDYVGNYDSSSDVDGRHIARFTGEGLFGLGPVFGVTTPAGGGSNGSPIYYRPASIMHIGEDNNDQAWAQISNTQGTGMTEDDGLRLGIRRYAGDTYGFLRWQENRAFIIQTDWNAVPGGINNGERLRITTINDDSQNIPQPGNVITNNTTRVSISYLGSSPVTEPRSLLHLGMNSGAGNGWRDWMDIGTYTSNGADHVYMGFKQETTGAFGISDRMDATIAWGDNVSGNNVGPDNMRFIFTEALGGSVAGNPDGLEIARMTPESDGTSNGMLGVGDFTGANVTHKLHVQGNGRFELVPTDASAEYILLGKQEAGPDDISMRKLAFTNDPADVLLGDGTWGPINASTDDQNLTGGSLNGNFLTINIENGTSAVIDLSGLASGTDDQNLTGASLSGTDLTIDIENGNSVTVSLAGLLVANNGVSISPADEIQLGVPCEIGGVTNGTGVNANALTASRAVGLGKQNLWFSTNVGESGSVGFGEVDYTAPFCNVGNTVEISANANSPYAPATGASGLRFRSLTAGSPTLANGTNGVNSAKVLSVDGDGDVVLVDAAIGGGVGGYCPTLPSALTDDFEIPMGDFSYNFTTGFQGRINIGQVYCGLNAFARVYIRNNNSFQSAIRAESQQAGGIGGYFTGEQYGIYAQSSSGPGLYAGYFNGDVFTTGTYWPSDQNLKTNIVDYDSSLYVISQLEPKSFEYDNSYAPQMNLSSGHQYGLIAQEVENVLPSVVTAVSVPAEYDSLGTLVHPAKMIKGVDYEQFIPILVGGIQEQQSIINEQDSLITDLNARLTSLENCLSGVLPYLCQLSNTTITQNDKNSQERIVKELEVILEDNSSIVLEQNVPNPFAEQTVIEYFIPEAVNRAQIHFYNVSGQLIKSVEVEEMGKGKITVFASDLSTGTYTYTLVADGQVISTKKMVKTH